MGIRLTLMIVTYLIAITGVTASAYSLTQGQTDQAIAFAWPAIALATAIAIMIPARRAAQRPVEGGVKNGA